MVKLSKEIIVNCGPRETRVAVLEQGELVELFIERVQEQRLVGHIFKGRVSNVLPGMQAAFVNIGLQKNAFLYLDDALESVAGVDETPEIFSKASAIKDVVKQGQMVVVQVSKEHFGNKGARITRHITLPGRFVVLMPTVDYVGVSRRIPKGESREELKALVEELRPPGMGVIARTMAEGCSRQELKRDIDFLHGLWLSIRNKAKEAKAPALLHTDLTLLYRVIRDSLDEDVTRLVVDDHEEYQSVRELLTDISPNLVERVHLFALERPVFDVLGIEPQVERITNRRVWLKSGGYIVIDHTEALTVIDVNTGKFVGSTKLSDTVLKTNLEAAETIARQLRLRNIGGIIVVDFIDMEEEEHQRRVLTILSEALSRDKIKSAVLGLTHLGLVEITRQKVSQGLAEFLQKDCPTCGGSGKVLTEETAAIRIENQLRQFLAVTSEEAVLVRVHPETAAMLIGVNGKSLERLEAGTGKKVYVRGDSSLRPDEHTVVVSGTVAAVQTVALPVSPGEIHTVLIEGKHNSRSSDGIARMEGFVLQVTDAAALNGTRVAVEITRVFKTFARAKLVSHAN
ncbi:MAG TPA: Rne/Rng family ribonuclease [Bacillota bacterium]|nr:Rne/Rng family ribonuclease [Bacillota bacterium]